MTYREMVIRNSPRINTDPIETKLSLGGLGIAGEAGEVADLIKKNLHHGKPLDRDKLLKELGDVRWYMEYLMLAVGTTMEEVENLNIEKCLARYPNGFNFADAAARRDEAVAG